VDLVWRSWREDLKTENCLCFGQSGSQDILIWKFRFKIKGITNLPPFHVSFSLIRSSPNTIETKVHVIETWVHLHTNFEYNYTTTGGKKSFLKPINMKFIFKRSRRKNLKNENGSQFGQTVLKVFHLKELKKRKKKLRQLTRLCPSLLSLSPFCVLLRQVASRETTFRKIPSTTSSSAWANLFFVNNVISIWKTIPLHP
jgi:hypothetical protein